MAAGPGHRIGDPAAVREAWGSPIRSMAKRSVTVNGCLSPLSPAPSPRQCADKETEEEDHLEPK